MKDIEIRADEVSVQSRNSTTVQVNVVGADEDHLLAQFEPREIVGALGKGAMLDEIGEDACVEHFGIKVAQE